MLDIIQRKVIIAEPSRQFNLSAADTDIRVGQAKLWMEKMLPARPEDVLEQFERVIRTPLEARGETMLELRARKGWKR